MYQNYNQRSIIKMHYQNTSDLKEKKVSKNLAKDKNIWKSSLEAVIFFVDILVYTFTVIPPSQKFFFTA